MNFFRYFDYFSLIKSPNYIFYMGNISVSNMYINDIYGVIFKGNLSTNSNILEKNGGYFLDLYEDPLYFSDALMEFNQITITTGISVYGVLICGNMNFINNTVTNTSKKK